MYRADRKAVDKVRGGGILLYIKDTISSQEVDKLHLESMEYLAAKIFLGIEGADLILGVFYRAPDSGNEGDKAMFEAMSRMSNKTAIILGDFNYPNIDWVELSNNHINNEFLEVVNDNFFSTW